MDSENIILKIQKFLRASTRKESKKGLGQRIGQIKYVKREIFPII